MQDNVITATPSSYLFKADELRVLKDTLNDIDSNTLMVPIMSPSDLTINLEGTLTGGYRYTGAAFVQVCSMLSPGLYNLVLGISGQWRSHENDIRDYSKELAVDMFNRLLKLRFDRRVVNMQMIKNTKEKTIAGVVGNRYKFLANSEFLSRILDICNRNASAFTEACLYGRNFIIRFTNTNKVKPYDIFGDHYNFGYHFANSEIGGQAVRAATLLIKQDSGYSALCPFSGNHGGRVVHSGRTFDKKLHGLVEQVITCAPQHDAITAGAKLLDKSLNLGNKDDSKRIQQLTTLLTRRKLTQGFAKKVITATVSSGRNEVVPVEDYDTDSVITARKQRNGYDLFVSVIRAASKLPIVQREIAEQFAYSLLLGKINF